LTENTLAVPNPNQPPIIPIIRDKSFRYQPPEDPPRTIYEDKSCPSDPQVNQMQGTKKEKASQGKAKSCLYTSTTEPKSILYFKYLNSRISGIGDIN